MYATQTKAPYATLAVCSVMSLLTLVMPPSSPAQEAFSGATMPPGAPVVCLEPQAALHVLQASRTPAATTPHGVPEAHGLLLSAPQASPPPQEPVDQPLQVPPALLRRLLAPEEGRRHTVELRVPEALLTILATEGLNQTP